MWGTAASQAGLISTKASAAVSGATSVAGSSSSGPLFRTLFTALETGHSRTVPGGAGRSSSGGSPASSPSHTGQSSGSRITGMRSCKSAMSSFAAVVAMVNVRNTSPAGSRQPSHSPAKARGAPSVRAIA